MSLLSLSWLYLLLAPRYDSQSNILQWPEQWWRLVLHGQTAFAAVWLRKTRWSLSNNVIEIIHWAKCHEPLPPPPTISSSAIMWLDTDDQSTVKRWPIWWRMPCVLAEIVCLCKPTYGPSTLPNASACQSPSSPPRNVSPLVNFTSSTPFWILRMEMLNVLLLRSYVRSNHFVSCLVHAVWRSCHDGFFDGMQHLQTRDHSSVLGGLDWCWELLK